MHKIFDDQAAGLRRIMASQQPKIITVFSALPAESQPRLLTQLAALVESGQPITSADFSPDGSRVVLSVGTWGSTPGKSRGEVQIWQMAD